MAASPSLKLDAAKITSSTWNKPGDAQQDPNYWVKIYTESNDIEHGTLVYTKAPREKLFRLVPALKKYVHLPTGQILLPGPANGIDEETLCTVIDAALTTTWNDVGFELQCEEHPIAYVKMHVILVLLEQNKMAQILQDRFWVLFECFLLTYEDVQWIWETFSTGVLERQSTSRSTGQYVPPFSDFYIETMAWHILNVRAVKKLSMEISEYIYGDGTTSRPIFGKIVPQPLLRKIVDKREQKYGLQKGYKPPSPVPLPTLTNPFGNLGVSSEFEDMRQRQGSTFLARGYAENTGQSRREPEVPGAAESTKKRQTHTKLPPPWSVENETTGLPTKWESHEQSNRPRRNSHTSVGDSNDQPHIPASETDPGLKAFVNITTGLPARNLATSGGAGSRMFGVTTNAPGSIFGNTSGPNSTGFGTDTQSQFTQNQPQKTGPTPDNQPLVGNFFGQQNMTVLLGNPPSGPLGGNTSSFGSGQKQQDTTGTAAQSSPFGSAPQHQAHSHLGSRSLNNNTGAGIFGGGTGTFGAGQQHHNMNASPPRPWTVAGPFGNNQNSLDTPTTQENMNAPPSFGPNRPHTAAPSFGGTPANYSNTGSPGPSNAGSPSAGNQAPGTFFGFTANPDTGSNPFENQGGNVAMGPPARRIAKPKGRRR